jgi:tetratricopeptide (TPR) repeat protein
VRLPVLMTLVLAAAACQRPSSETAGDGQARGPLAEARTLYDRGELDEALAKTLDAPADDPAGLCLQGLIWARKAERAPVPTPPPDVPGARPPEFKTEELTAIDFLERARAARPDLAEAHLGLASLLAPHAIRRFEVSEAGRRAAPRRGEARSAASGGVTEGPDFSVGHVAELFKEAAKGVPANPRALDELQRFATRVRDLDSQEWALIQLIAARGENADPRVRYGDFLVNARKDRHKAIDYYRQALILRPDDAGIKSRLADQYIAIGREHFDVQQWNAAQTMFLEAEKYVVDKKSPQGMMVRDHLEQLATIRRTRP